MIPVKPRSNFEIPLFFRVLKVVTGLLFTLGPVYLFKLTDDQVGTLVIGFIFGYGLMKLVFAVMSFTMKPSVSRIGPGMPPNMDRKDCVEFGFTMETLEGGQEGLETLSKMLKRAIQIRNCKRNSDVEAFKQAHDEAAEVAMLELKDKLRSNDNADRSDN